MQSRHTGPLECVCGWEQIYSAVKNKSLFDRASCQLHSSSRQALPGHLPTILQLWSQTLSSDHLRLVPKHITLLLIAILYSLVKK